jgi:AraC-like DNA-binding protein
LDFRDGVMENPCHIEANMDGDTMVEDGPRRRFFVDVTAPVGARDAFDILRSGWDTQVGNAIPLPPSAPIGTSDYRVRIKHAKVDDAVIENLYSDAIVGGTGGDFSHLNDRIVLHVVRRGEWSFTGPRSHTTVTVPAGGFIVRNNDPAWRFGVRPATSATVLILPTEQLRPHLGERHVAGSADSAEIRLLCAHARMVEENLDALTPAGVQAARAALVELTKAVVTGGVDAGEPLLAPALTQAARDIVDNHLTHPDLSPAMLAHELHVSVRTLHRAFATTDESTTAYIRRRRLEQARLDLAAMRDRPAVSEIAARWQFADASHFIRAFKARYGQTPAQFARSVNPAPDPAREQRDGSHGEDPGRSAG